MKYLRILICFTVIIPVESLIASDVFPEFSKKPINFAVPTNTPGCIDDTSFLVGTNYIYKLKGQSFSNPAEGHIQSTVEGFGGKTDESTPWKTLTELFAVYQNGSDENQMRSIYDLASNGFLNKVYGSEQMKTRFQKIGRSISGMQAVLGYEYLGGYLAQVRLDFKDGHHEVSQYFFVLDGIKYKLSAAQIKKPEPSFMNIGLFLNKKPPQTLSPK